MAISENNSTSTERVRLGGLRSLLILAALALLLSASWAAWRQVPRTDPLHLPQAWVSWDWWVNPVEENVLQRVNSVSASQLNSVFFLLNNRNGWAVGDKGAILATTDGGQHWGAQASGTTQSVRSVQFIDAQHGWVVGDEGTILTTTDGGQHWLAQTSGAPQRLNSVQFSDVQHGWVVGYGGTILTTTDGGQHWLAQTSNTTTPLLSVHFTDAQRGWVLGADGTVLATSDGGRRWQAQTGNARENLYSVYFVDAQHGWAVGGHGLEGNSTILATSDGGRNWQMQSSDTRQYLHSVYFADAQHGWVVGSDLWDRGIILATSDGGQHWQTQTSNTRQHLQSVYFSNALRGWAVGSGGTIVATSDGGQHWQAQTSNVTQNLNSVYFVDAQHGWAVGSSVTVFGDFIGLGLSFFDVIDGFILATADGGQHWRAQSSNTRQALNSVYFSDAQHGWAVGNHGTILTTADGGQHWQTQTSNARQNLNSVYFADPQHGWAAGDDGTILATADGGQRWQRQTSNTNEELGAIHFADNQHGWAMSANSLFRNRTGGLTFGGGSSRVVLATADGGQHWQIQTPGTMRDPMSVGFADSSNRRSVIYGGTILAVTDGGQYWQTLPNEARRNLNSVYFVDAEQGWAAGLDGTILATADGGRHWRAQTSNTAQELGGIHFANTQLGWAVGFSNTILATTDGGQHWQRTDLNAEIAGKIGAPSSSFFVDTVHGIWIGSQARYETHDGGGHWTEAGAYRRYFAPWWWLAAGLSLILAGIAAAIDPGTVKQSSLIEGALASDAPITHADQDQLGYARIADGLAGFITNPRTAPPLSVSITGPWGKGKSSIMALLRRQLAAWRFPVVWFNAWHHQQSEQILASLFAHIREQAVPSLWSPRGWVFRAKLAGVRVRQRPALPLLMLLALSFAVGVYTTSPARFSVLAETVMSLFAPADATKAEKLGATADATDPAAKTAASALGVAMPMAPLVRLGSAAAAILVFVFYLLRLFTVFGVSPRSLMPRIVGSLRPGSLGSPPAARYRFAKDFREVCAAYGLRRLVVFIDDIDRCEPAAVPEVLGLVNFLMSSGDCFVVLGAEKSWVQAAVANTYKDLAQTVREHSPNEDGNTPKEFARRYLEKLLNLEVPVTASGDNVVKAMLAQRKSKTDKTPRWNSARLLSFVRGAWPVLAILLLITTAAGLGVKAGLGGETPPPTVADGGKPAINLEPQCAPGAAPDPRCALARKPDGKDKKPEALGIESWVIPAGPDESHFPWLTVVFSVITLSLLAFLAVLRLPRFLREDSPNFQKALEVWADWLSERHTTPRSFKRFVNKVRFLAMLERGENAAVASWGARIRRLWSRRRVVPPGGEDLLSPAIVAYAATLTRQNHWRRELLLPAFPVGGSEPNKMALANAFDTTRAKAFETVYAELRETVQAHRTIDSFKAADTAEAWLPSPNIQKLIEQVMFPDGVEPLAQTSAQPASTST